MKKSIALQPILISLIIIISAVFIIILAKNNKPVSLLGTVVKENQDKEKLCCADLVASENYTDNSIYNLNSVWKNEFNTSIKLSSFKGKKVILTMFFASCTYACPLLVNDMKRVEAELSEKEKHDVIFVLVSIDPENDTPAILKDYSSVHKLETKRWELLNGSEDEIRELAALLGFKYERATNGGFSHSNIITVLNANGEIIYQHEGLNKDLTALVNNIK